MIQTAIYGILWFLTICVASAVAKWWKVNKENEAVITKLEQLKAWGDIAVRYARDFGDEQELAGKDRREIAIRMLQDIRDKYDLDYNDDMIKMLIRAAYTVMTDESADVILEDDEAWDFDEEIEDDESAIS